jgi:hypothetical protein
MIIDENFLLPAACMKPTTDNNSLAMTFTRQSVSHLKSLRGIKVLKTLIICY